LHVPHIDLALEVAESSKNDHFESRKDDE